MNNALVSCVMFVILFATGIMLSQPLGSGFFVVAHMLALFGVASGPIVVSFLILLVIFAVPFGVLRKLWPATGLFAGLFLGTGTMAMSMSGLNPDESEWAYLNSKATNSLRMSKVNRDEIGSSGRHSLHVEKLGNVWVKRTNPPQLDRGHPTSQRLEGLAWALQPQLAKYNNRATLWTVGTKVIADKDVTYGWLSGGKAYISNGALETLKITDDELIYFLAWALAHSIWEHEAKVRDEDWGDTIKPKLSIPERMLKDELEADLIGFEMAARAGVSPLAGLSMWEKLLRPLGSKVETVWGGPLGAARIREVIRNMSAMLKIYETSRR